MVVSQGEIWWAELRSPLGSEAGYRRPVLIVQGDHLNRSHIRTAVCVPISSNLRFAQVPGNVLLSPRESGLPKDSVANVTQIMTVTREQLIERVAKLPDRRLFVVLAGIDLVLGR